MHALGGPTHVIGKFRPEFRLASNPIIRRIVRAVALLVQSAQGYEQKAMAAGHREGQLATDGATPPPDFSDRTEHAANGKLMRVLGTGALLVGATAGVGTLLYVWLPNDTQFGLGTHGVGVRVRW
ncbi:hypothetical protein WMF28_39410 [Sorangium sp. So ce590]|uniref:hypothetical protein n=1 Tax=Sorangium sp. So ce590 TaxID=3133317 RepID=UPI003F6132EF